MKTTVLAVDPGVAATGVVLVCGGRITEVHTWTTKPASIDRWRDLQARAGLQALRILDHLEALPGGAHVVIEAFEDFGGGHLREAHSRYYTPFLLGYVAARVVQHPIHLHWQAASVVLRATRAYREHWEAGRRGLVPGDELLTNEHLRSAACHAVHLEGALRVGRGVA